MEYLGGGSALDLMKSGPFEEHFIAIILREILRGLEYLHAEGKLHRDIKGSPLQNHSIFGVNLYIFCRKRELCSYHYLFVCLQSHSKVVTLMIFPFFSRVTGERIASRPRP